MRSVLVLFVIVVLTAPMAHAAGDGEPGAFSVEETVHSLLTAFDRAAEHLVSALESFIQSESAETDLGPVIVPDGEEETANAGPMIDPLGDD